MERIFTFLLFGLSLSLFAQDPGTLDITYGDNGGAFFGQVSIPHWGGYLTVQNDDTILLAGSSGNLAGVGRFNSNGSLDTTFGTEGEVFLDFTGNDSESKAIGVQSNGKIIVAGISYLGATPRFATMRLNVDGSPDATFGDNGLLIETFLGFSSRLADVTILPNDDILAIGQTGLASGVGAIAMIKYKEDGTPDLSFGDNGYVLTNVSGLQAGKGMFVEVNGNILVVGETRTDLDGLRNVIVTRYLENGTLDNSFGDEGVVITSVHESSNIDEYPTAVSVRENGKIMVAGFSSDGSGSMPFAIQYDGSGNLDPSFGVNGIAVFNGQDTHDRIYDFIIQPDNKVIMCGVRYVQNEHKPVLIRFDESGDLDPSFGEDGIALIDMYDSFGKSLWYQSTGKLILGGSTIFPDNSSALTTFRVHSGFDLGILDFGTGSSFSIIPNPVNENTALTYSLINEEVLSISLYDSSGKKIKDMGSRLARKKGANTEFLNFTGIQKGNYILNISNSTGSMIGIKIQKK
ncbi:MAG: hypothetical protein Aureis2KO_19640 [Aureisphaera sp.]